MKQTVNAKHSISTNISLLANSLIEQCPVHYTLIAMFLLYEAALLVKMPLSMHASCTQQYAELFDLLTKMDYTQYLLSYSESAVYMITIVHLLICSAVPVLIFGMMIFSDLTCQNRKNNIYSKIVIFSIIIQYTVMLYPMSSNFIRIIMGTIIFPLHPIMKPIAVLGILCTLFSSLVSPMLFSVNPNSKVPWAGTFTMLHYYRTAIKLIVSLYLSFDYLYRYSSFANIVLCVPIFIYFIATAFTDMIYHRVIFFSLTFQIGLIALLSFTSVILWLSNIEYCVEYVILITMLGCIATSLIMMHQQTYNSMILSKQIDKIESQKESEAYVISLYRLYTRSKFSISLLSCICQNKTIFNNSESPSFPVYNKHSQNKFKDLVSFGEFIFTFLCNKFETSELLKLIYSLYLWDISHNLYKSYYLLLQSLTKHISIHHLILASKQLKDIKTYYQTKHSPIFAQIQQSVQFYTLTHCFSQACLHTTQYFISLFGILSQAEVNIKLLQAQVINAANSYTQSLNFYSEINSISTVHLESYYRMSCFHDLVLQNQSYLSQFIEINEKQCTFANSSYEAEHIYDVSGSSMIVIISGDDSTLETILHVTNESSLLLNYKPCELIKQSLSLILPPIFREYHRQFISQFQLNGENKILNSKCVVFAFTKQCTIVLMEVYVSSLMYINHRIRYIGYLRKLKKTEAFKHFDLPSDLLNDQLLQWIVDTNGNLVGVDDSTSNYLAIPKQYLEFKKGNLNMKIYNVINDSEKLISQLQTNSSYGADSTINFWQFIKRLDADLINELKIDISDKYNIDAPVYIRITKSTIKVMYYTVSICIIKPHTAQLSPNQEIVNIDKSNSSTSVCSLLCTAQGIPKKYENKWYKAMIVLVIILICASIIFNTSALFSTSNSFNEMFSILLASNSIARTTAFILNIASLLQFYNKDPEPSLKPILLNYIGSLPKYIEEIGEQKFNEYASNVSTFEMGYDGSINATLQRAYSTMILLTQKMNYLVNYCSTQNANTANVKPSILDNTADIEKCQQLQYEVFYGSYYYFFIPLQTTLSNLYSQFIQSAYSQEYKFRIVTITNIVVLLVCVHIMAVISALIRKFNSIQYYNLITIPKEYLTKRMINAKTYLSIEANSTKLQSYCQTHYNKWINDAAPAMPDTTKHQTQLSISNMSMLSLIWMSAMIAILCVMIFAFMYVNSMLVASLEAYGLITGMHVSTNEMSFLFCLSCEYKAWVYLEYNHSIPGLISAIKGKRQTLTSYMPSDSIMEYRICDVITDPSSIYYSPFINSNECNEVYKNIFKHRTSEVIDIYYDIIEDTYYEIMFTQNCGNESLVMDLFKLQSLYLSPILITQLIQVRAIIETHTGSVQALYIAFNSIMLAMLAISLFLVSFSNSKIVKEKNSLGIVQQHLRI